MTALLSLPFYMRRVAGFLYWPYQIFSSGRPIFAACSSGYSRDRSVLKLWKKYRGDVQFFVVFLICFGLFRSVAFASYHIPSESMVPTLEVGDRIIVSKWPYGYSKHSVWFPFFSKLPDTNIRLLGNLPERGDVAVFKHTQDDIVMIKRVIGLPGDEISVIDGVLHVNGGAVERNPVRAYAYREHKGSVVRVRQYAEILPEGMRHTIIERSDTWRGDSAGPYFVPEGHVFMMGDNRDNSADSRFMSGLGFVPVEHLIGRAEMIFASTHGCTKEEGLECAPRRFVSPIH